MVKVVDAIMIAAFLAVLVFAAYGAGKRDGFMQGFTAAAPFAAARSILGNKEK